MRVTLIFYSKIDLDCYYTLSRHLQIIQIHRSNSTLSNKYGAKHSFPFLTLTLSWGRGNMAPEAFDVLQCK